MPITAILFPGQGSQSPDMRETVARVRPELVDAVIEAVGEDPFERVEDGTMFAQPAISCASLAGWTDLGRPMGDFMAGHSRGELGALIAAGCLSERDGVELVALRGRLMQDAGDGGMLALLGPGAAEHAAELAAAHDLAVANDNCPTQVVLSGPRERLLAEALTRPVRWRETLLELRRRGAERFIEVGPGRVLTGLVKRTLSDVELVHA